MQRQARFSLAATLVFGSAAALAQDGDLARVTMRVLDSVSDVDAVVLELDANRGEAEDGAAAASAEGADRDAAADDDERSRDEAAEAAAEDARRAERRERDELHDVDADERGEGRLEDRDVERRVVPPATVP